MSVLIEEEHCHQVQQRKYLCKTRKRTYEPGVVKEAVENFFGIILHSRGEDHPGGDTVDTDTIIRPPFDC